MVNNLLVSGLREYTNCKQDFCRPINSVTDSLQFLVEVLLTVAKKIN